MTYIKKKEQKRGKRGVVYLLMLTMLATILAGCGGKSYSLDEEKLANTLLDNVKFDCNMYQVKNDKIGDFITTENPEKEIMYMGNGAYGDSFGIFTLSDEDSAKKTAENVQSYLTDLQESFQDYLPDEAAEIEKNVTVQKGKYVVFCVSPDPEKVQKLIDESFVESDGNDSSQGTNTEDKKSDNTADAQTTGAGGNVDGTYPVITADGAYKEYGNVITIGDTAFELYSYLDTGAEKYAGAVNSAADKLKGQASVYEIPIPLSSGITLPDEYYSKISSSDQKKAIDAILAKADDNVKTVNIYENMMEHRDEYIYFRTDHHWTALGAYYGYEKFCEEKGIMPVSLERREKQDFSGFLGSFYNDTKNSKLGKNPDTLTAYYPISNVSMQYTDKNGKKISWDVIYDVSKYPANIKYSAFIGGDNPFTEITNEDIQDGSSCLVVKESFGNAFVPYLTDHYEKVYVVDYRYWEGSIVSLAEEKGVDDVLFVNNLSMIRNDYLTGKLAQLI